MKQTSAVIGVCVRDDGSNSCAVTYDARVRKSACACACKYDDRIVKAEFITYRIHTQGEKLNAG